MKTKPMINTVLWMIPSVLLMLVLVLVVARERQGKDSAAQVAFKARRVDLVSRMQLGLASASEAEKSAVMAITDQESMTFADEARAASAEVERERVEVEDLLRTAGTPGERELLAQFSQVSAEFQRVDDEVLRLAVQNTNLKASSLAFGPAAKAVDEMNAALARVVADHAEAPDAKKAMLLGFGSQVAVLRILTLIPPHIAEESDQKEDELEASMAKEEAQARAGLDGLAALPSLGGSADLATAASRYATFSGIKAQILKLSRENTNVRSLAISLTQKRKMMVLCLNALDALKQAILAEPIAGVTYGAQTNPRHMK
jgi:hypothetical protein